MTFRDVIQNGEGGLVLVDSRLWQNELRLERCGGSYLVTNYESFLTYPFTYFSGYAPSGTTTPSLSVVRKKGSMKSKGDRARVRSWVETETEPHEELGEVSVLQSKV